MSSPANQIIDGARRATTAEARTYRTLDGLRGFAALAVLVWHSPGGRLLLPSAYMAVDLFFILSGFVLAYRYGDRLRTLRDARMFTVARIIRLYPLYLLGTLMGAAVALAVALTHGHVSPAFFSRLGLGVLMLPVIRMHHSTFPFNSPAWSLFWELAINIVFAFTVRWTSPRVLLAIIAGSAAGLLIAVAIQGDMHFTVKMPLFLVGGLRAVFGFYVGVLLYRLLRDARLPRWRVHPAAIVALLLPCFLVPAHAGALTAVLLLVVSFLAFPAIIVAGVNNEPRGRLARIMQFLGLLSFPLYAVHRPLLKLVTLGGERIGWSDGTIMLVCAIVALLGGWLAARFFDRPLARWLTGLARARFGMGSKVRNKAEVA